jgi:hypothetical protein
MLGDFHQYTVEPPSGASAVLMTMPAASRVHLLLLVLPTTSGFGLAPGTWLQATDRAHRGAQSFVMSASKGPFPIPRCENRKLSSISANLLIGAL